MDNPQDEHLQLRRKEFEEPAFQIIEGENRKLVINLDQVDYALIEAEDGKLKQMKYNGEHVNFQEND